MAGKGWLDHLRFIPGVRSRFASSACIAAGELGLEITMKGPLVRISADGVGDDEMQESVEDFTQDYGGQPTTFKRRIAYLVMTLTNLGVLFGLLLVIDQSTKEFTFLDFIAPYKKYLSLAVIAVFGWLAVGSGSRWVHSMAVRWASADTATAVRILFRIVAGGVLLSTIVSTLTDSATAAITMGSFTGLVAGFATQTVLGNAVAGLFLGISRPISIGDNVTVSGNSGTVVAITLMHTVLRTDEQDILIPSSSVAHGVIVRRREPAG